MLLRVEPRGKQRAVWYKMEMGAPPTVVTADGRELQALQTVPHEHHPEEDELVVGEVRREEDAEG